MTCVGDRLLGEKEREGERERGRGRGRETDRGRGRGREREVREAFVGVLLPSMHMCMRNT